MHNIPVYFMACLYVYMPVCVHIAMCVCFCVDSCLYVCFHLECEGYASLRLVLFRVMGEGK